MRGMTLSILTAAILATVSVGAVPASPAATGRVALKIDTSEADAVLAILAERASGKAVAEESWRRLFASEPYVRLKKREDSFHIGFTDDDFRKFVLSDGLAGNRAALASTLSKWRSADLNAAAGRALAYLPAAAVIRASVYPVIKPGRNSFVFETATNPAIFLFLDPEVPAAKFENTVAHELHHIGFASVTDPKAKNSAEPPNVAAAIEWLGAFGEGFAMLAAAGSPDVHPHAVSPAKERERWDRDMLNFNRDLRSVEAFFLDVLDGKRTREKIDEAGMAFFGEQGPWYTVGYEMAVVIEKHDGRAALIACMSDPRKLLATYDGDAADLNSKSGERLALWSPRLLEKLGAR